MYTQTKIKTNKVKKKKKQARMLRGGIQIYRRNARVSFVLIINDTNNNTRLCTLSGEVSHNNWLMQQGGHRLEFMVTELAQGPFK